MVPRRPMPERRKPPPRPSLSVVVPATGAAPTLERWRSAIDTSIEAPDEVIVVDQQGLAVVDARNMGARRSRCDVVVFVDADVLVHADAFTRIRDAFQADPGLSALIGAYDDSPSAADAISGFRNLLHHHINVSAAGPVTTFWTGLGAIRKSAFESVGGFDEEFRWPRRSPEPLDFMADVALGFRLAEAGHRILLDPGIQGTHLKRWTLWQMVYTDFLLRGVPWVRLMLRRRSAPGHLNLGWRHRISAVVTLLGAGAMLTRRRFSSAALLTALVALNRPFYVLLLRRRGPVQATAGVGAHAIHHLTSLASLITGLAIHLAERPRDAPATPEPAPPGIVSEEPSLNGEWNLEPVRLLPG